jgi:hypothetical protein
MDYTIPIHQAQETGFWSEVPALLGGYSQGETINESVQSAFKGGTSYGPKGIKDWSPIEEKFFSYAEFVLKLQISVFCERLPIYLQKH